ncbi:hypothetical protein SAMN04488056_101462 [Cohaesibacter marisflavi]|uniref:Uncharacterized protein n=1 Tax=Cohaesibacter marisflavi TaxID=655353 RepID=A0A1I5AF01_9HYPH|nr:hypothetical protein [Cohaesibacter marisflavi]SFN60992.1 hypothetical protein SAMN04488056_101462 [Cohaesibacter marisflavi]
MASIISTITIAVIGVFLTAWFNHIHWLNKNREEIRIRETIEATSLVRDIANIFDKRIVTQRLMLRNIFLENREVMLEEYKKSLREYSERYNEVRFRLRYFSSYSYVIDFERELNDKIVENSYEIEHILKYGRPKKLKFSELNEQLNIISVRVYEYCALLTSDISSENIGVLKKINDWKDPNNKYISSLFLIKRLLSL